MNFACDEANAKGEIGIPALCKTQAWVYRFTLKNLNLGQGAFDAAQEEAFWKIMVKK